MSEGAPKKPSDAERYRLQVRLAAVIREAKAEARPDLVEAATLLRAQVGAVEDAEAEALFTAVLPKVLVLEGQLGLMPHGAPALPKWMRYALFTGPAMLFLLLGFVLFARRRRKKKIGDAALAALERAGESS